MSRSRAALLTVLLMSCLGVVGCTGATPTPTRSTPVGPTVPPGGGTANACATLTTAEIQAIVGVPFNDGRVTSAAGDAASKCEWNAQDETIGVFTDVDLLPFDEDLWALQKGSSTSEPVANLGDEAFRWQVGSLGPAGILEIKYHGYEIDINVFGPSSDKQTVAGQQLALANLVLSRV